MQAQYFVGTQQQCASLATLVDAALGLPCCACGTPGEMNPCICTHHVLVGAGAHVSHAQSRTLTYAVAFKHHTLDQWAYPVTDTVLAIAPGTVAVTLTSDWWPDVVIQG